MASRGHHADIGGITPGSMPPFSKVLEDEGVAIKSFKIVENGQLKIEETKQLFKSSRLLNDNISDLQAQIASNNKGVHLLMELISETSLETTIQYMEWI